MTSVDAIGGDELPVCLDTSEMLSSREEAVTSYQNPGPNSGFTRMRQEEVLLSAVYQVQETLNLKEKCQKIYDLINKLENPYERDSCLEELIEKVAPLDPTLALKYASYIKDTLDRFMAELKVANFQSDEGAHQTLLKAKENCPRYLCLFYTLIALFEEEYKRGFPEAEQTLESLHNGNFTSDSSYHLWIASTQGKLGKLEEAQKALEKAFAIFQTEQTLPSQEFLESRLSYWISTIDLHEMLEVGAEYQLPITQDILQAFREHACQALYANERSHAWTHIIYVEVEHPHLHTLLDQEVKNIIKVFQIVEAEDSGFMLYRIFMRLLPVRPDLAKEIFQIMPQGYEHILASIKLFEYYPENGNLNALVEIVEKDGYSDLFLDLFSAVKKHDGLEKALPYLDRAKELAEDEWDLTDILEVELEQELSSSKETLNLIYQYMETEEDYDLEDIIIAIIHGEFA